jgi:hypothetical protein
VAGDPRQEMSYKAFREKRQGDCLRKEFIIVVVICEDTDS